MKIMSLLIHLKHNQLTLNASMGICNKSGVIQSIHLISPLDNFDYFISLILTSNVLNYTYSPKIP